MVSRESQKSRSIQLHRHKSNAYNLLRSSGVSKAIWPTYKRRRVATGRIAQIRRTIIGVITDWMHSYQVIYGRYCQVLSQHVTIAHATQCSITVLATTIIMTMSLLYDWSLPLVFIALCMMMTIIMMQFLLINAQQVDTNTSIPIDKQRSTNKQLATEVPPPIATSLPVTDQEIKAGKASGYPTLSFPDTPMPATPLIRILETIDLSSTNVEHFIDSQKQAPPETEITWHAQQNEPQASEETKHEV